jgi:hypothetical protein
MGGINAQHPPPHVGGYDSGPPGRLLDEVYPGWIERAWRQLDVPRLKTIFGRKKRPHQNRVGGGRLERILERFDHDLTVFKVHFGKLTLKM